MAADMLMSCVAMRVLRALPYPPASEDYRPHLVRVHVLRERFVRIACLDGTGGLISSIEGLWPEILGHMAAKIVFLLHRGVDLEAQTKSYMAIVRRLLRDAGPEPAESTGG